MSGRYPILISIPHGGDAVPPEVSDCIGITRQEMLHNGDPLTREIYDLKAYVEAVIEMPIARTIVDLNRAPYDIPPQNPDGVVKRFTQNGTPIYREGKFPDRAVIRALLAGYYYPYHARLARVLDSGRVVLALDCHSMLPYPPPMRRESGAARPLVCLSNGGNRQGMPGANGGHLTCPPEWIQALAEAFSRVFPAEGEVAINHPFLGGFISRAHSRRRQIPWIQVEINRCLYETKDHYGAEDYPVENERIAALRRHILSAIEGFWEAISPSAGSG